jgi:hypothetical protein
MKRTNKQFLTLLAISLGFTMLFMMACAVTGNDQPVTQTPDQVIFPNWKEADQSQGIENRYSDTWCAIAYHTDY